MSCLGEGSEDCSPSRLGERERASERKRGREREKRRGREGEGDRRRRKQNGWKGCREGKKEREGEKVIRISKQLAGHFSSILFLQPVPLLDSLETSAQSHFIRKDHLVLVLATQSLNRLISDLRNPKPNCFCRSSHHLKPVRGHCP